MVHPLQYNERQNDVPNTGFELWTSSATVTATAQAFKNGPTSASFIVYFRSFKTNITFLQQYNVMTIHYPVPGFESTTSWTRVSSHNH